MARYWLIDFELPETPELPAGYSFGLIDDANPLPDGAADFPNKKTLDAHIKTIEAREKEKTNNGKSNEAKK